MDKRRIFSVIIAVICSWVPLKASATFLHGYNSVDDSLWNIDTTPGSPLNRTSVGYSGLISGDGDLGLLNGGLFWMGFNITTQNSALFQIDTATGAGSAAIMDLPFWAEGLAGGPGEELYTIRNDTRTLVTINPFTSSYIDIGIGLGLTYEIYDGMAISRDGSTLYSVGLDLVPSTTNPGYNTVDSWNLVSIDVLTGQGTNIGQLHDGIRGLAIDEMGDLYGLQTGSAELFVIDQTTGDSVLVGRDFSSDLVGVTGLAPTIPISVPEPTSLALMGLGLAGLGFARRRKQSEHNEE